ncbi:hypothetical protein JS532_10415 [Bifidobacterium callimiconis]|uniref:hypothetical protein n=1 Tax=Bifidobacterium callimiconis TaxID=2306973 RepID=UPI001BDDBADB|nr:hypothetical protein [Bifidobacterium callimiconis]MBT1177957.1 hypothetical protein [Bifidobacterium callimiconis]
MPGWVWVLLVIFLLAMLITGSVYAVRRALAALHAVNETGGRVADIFARLDQEPTTGDAEAPSFILPLEVSADRYADAHSVVIRHQEETRSRHATVWKRWKTFNDLGR